MIKANIPSFNLIGRIHQLTNWLGWVKLKWERKEKKKTKWIRRIVYSEIIKYWIQYTHQQNIRLQLFSFWQCNSDSNSNSNHSSQISFAYTISVFICLLFRIILSAISFRKGSMTTKCAQTTRSLFFVFSFVIDVVVVVFFFIEMEWDRAKEIHYRYKSE